MELITDKIKPLSPLEDVKDIEELVRLVSLYQQGSRLKARLSITVASEPIENILNKKKDQLLIKRQAEQPDVIRCKLKYEFINESDVASCPEWLMINYQNTGIYLIVSFANYKIFNSIILKFIRGFYPKISRVYFNTGHIYHLLRRIGESDNNIDIRITKLVAKKRIESEGAQKSIASSIDWTDITFKEAFSKLYDEDSWIKSIDFKMTYFDNNWPYTSSGAISRHGLFTCKQNFRFFFYYIIKEALAKASLDKELFENRSRKENPGLKVRPLVIEFDKDIFKNKESNFKLISSLRKLKYSSLSVYHANPYLHASMIDYRDGSTYRIWVLSENAITIVPQMRATIGSLERLFNHIGETFMEGKITELIQK